jgi:hypothetical protein
MTNKKSEKQEIKADPPKPQKPAIIPNNVKPLSSKKATVMPVKEKSVESNLIDDHTEDYDVTPGMDERGKEF